jgi:hypothetical protein
MAHVLTIDGTVTALNQYCSVNGKEVQQKLKQDLEFEKMLPFVSCERTWTPENVTIGNLLQPYQAAFTPNNSETWSGVENTLEHGKVDLEFDALQLEEFYDAWKCNWFEMDMNPMQWSYPRYIIENHIMPQLIEDINLASYAGERVDPTPGTPGTYLQSWDGFQTRIEDAITGGDLTPVNTGALVSANMDTIVRDWVQDLPIPYRNAKGFVFMSTTRAQEYADAFAGNNNTLVPIIENPDKPYYKIPHHNKSVVPMNCMEGSDRFIFFPEKTGNFVIGTRKGQSIYPRFRFQEVDRKLKVLSEFSRFYGIKHWENLFVNDQA